MGIRVGNFKSQASSLSQINFKTQLFFAIKALYFYFYEFQFVKDLRTSNMITFCPTKILSVADCSLLINKLANTLIRKQQHVSLLRRPSKLSETW